MTTPPPPPPLTKDSRNLLRVLDYHRISLVLDVGANVGQYASRLRQGGYGGRIVGFEPLAGAHADLLRLTGDDPDWTIAPRAAVGAAETPIRLHVSAETDMSSALDFTAEMADLLDSSAFVAEETVPQIRLDRVFGDHAAPEDRVLLKIDTQGYERPVLDGASGVLDRIHAIQLELSIIEVYAGEPSYLDMIAHLDALGFAPILFLPGYFNRRTARLMQMDGVFVRKGAEGHT